MVPETDTVLLEWAAREPSAAAYDGGPPRELLRIRQPFVGHNGCQIAFNPTAAPGDADFGLLHVGIGDGGSQGDPLDLAQDLGSVFGKILRIDPLGGDSANRRYGIPADNPFAGGGALGEIYAYGMRHPQRFAWDPLHGALFVADIGQDVVEEVSPVTPGANLGWKVWEGSFRHDQGVQPYAVHLDGPRADPGMTYPIVEYDHRDPLLQADDVAITGLVIQRGIAVPQLANLFLFGDLVSGEVFAAPADVALDGGQRMHRVLFEDQGMTASLLEMIRARNVAQGQPVASRADLRFGTGPGGQVFLLNKRDGLIRRLRPSRPAPVCPVTVPGCGLDRTP